MQQLSLTLEGNPILTQPCVQWAGQEDAETLVRDMTRIMFATNGLGLSAPQVGKNYRMFVMGNENKLLACFNPRIVSASTEMEMGKEGCLSFPGLWLNVRRHTDIVVEYEDVKGITQTHHLEGLMARCFQHELDHLHGVCFVDRTAKLSLKLARDRQTKWIKKGIK
jgi:peptide deformylase